MNHFPQVNDQSASRNFNLLFITKIKMLAQGLEMVLHSYKYEVAVSQRSTIKDTVTDKWLKILSADIGIVIVDITTVKDLSDAPPETVVQGLCSLKEQFAHASLIAISGTRNPQFLGALEQAGPIAVLHYEDGLSELLHVIKLATTSREPGPLFYLSASIRNDWFK